MAISDNLADNAAAPKKSQGDSGSMEQHPLPDQIEADRYLKSQNALKNGSRLGYRRVLLRPGNNADVNVNGSCG